LLRAILSLRLPAKKSSFKIKSTVLHLRRARSKAGFARGDAGQTMGRRTSQRPATGRTTFKARQIRSALTFRELEALAGALLTVLLAFVLARIASQESTFLQRR